MVTAGPTAARGTTVATEVRGSCFVVWGWGRGGREREMGGREREMGEEEGKGGR